MNQDERRFIIITEKQRRGIPLTKWENQQLERMLVKCLEPFENSFGFQYCYEPAGHDGPHRDRANEVTIVENNEAPQKQGD